MAEEIPIYRRRRGLRVILRNKVKVKFNTHRPTNFIESKVDDYMLRQPKINVKNREHLVDWLLYMHYLCSLNDITAFAAVDIFDRFLSAEVVSMEELNYVVLAAMHIATKYHETRIYENLSLDELILAVNGRLPDLHGLHRYRAQIMEKRILDRLGWELDVPTVYTFLTRFLNAAENPPDTTMEKMAYFFAKLGIWNYHLMTAFPPSMLAAAALYAACASTCKISMWRHTFQDYTGFKDTQLFKCSRRMVELHWVGHDEKWLWWIPFK